MKASKKVLTVVLGAALIGGLLPVNGYSKPKKGQKSAIQQLQEYFAKEEATEKKETPAVTSEQEEKPAAEVIKKTFTCGEETITVEYGDGEKATLTNGKGSYELVNTKAASGEFYSNNEGVSIHMKGNDGVYTSSSKSNDVSCELSK